MMARGRLGLLALALCVGLAGPAAAEPTAEDKAAAESLFQDALKLIREDKYVDACPKLEASNKLDPAVGTLFNLGDCYEHTGRTASAWSSFGDAKRLAVRLNDRRAAEAEQREKAMEPRLARLAVTAAEKPEGLVVLRDGKPLDAALLGSAVPVDPGKHTLEAKAPGREPWSTEIDVPDRPGTVTAAIPALAKAAAAASATASSSAGGPAAPPGGMGPQRIAGLAVGGVGIAGLVVGGVFGGLAASKTGESGGHCVDGEPDRCDPTGLSLRQQANDMATIANIALAAGGVLTAGGVVLYLLAPSPSAASTPQGASHNPTAGGPARRSSAVTVRVSPAAGAMNGLVVTGAF